MLRRVGHERSLRSLLRNRLTLGVDLNPSEAVDRRVGEQEVVMDGTLAPYPIAQSALSVGAGVKRLEGYLTAGREDYESDRILAACWGDTGFPEHNARGPRRCEG